VIATVDPADGFLLTGPKQRRVRLLPGASHTVGVTCLPIQPGGPRALPLLRLVAAREDGATYPIGPFFTTVL
jgi:hypothetical protein